MCRSLKKDQKNHNSNLDSTTTSIPSLYSSPWPTYCIKVLNTMTNVEQTLTCEALLNATGRSPNVHNLGLDEVGIYIYIYINNCSHNFSNNNIFLIIFFTR